MTRGEVMRRVRAQALLVQRLSGRMKEYAADGLRSPGLDGMPRGKGYAPGGVALRYEKREAMRAVIGKESEVLREYEQEARREMDRMRPELYAFCAMYYLAALDLEEVGEAIARSKRQCERYRAEVEEGNHPGKHTGSHVAKCL